MVKVHFLNVGHGDCTIIEHASGHLTMIDINNGGDLDSDSAKSIAEACNVQNYFVKSAVAEALGQRRWDILEKAGYQIELTNPVEFLKKMHPANNLFRYVQSHPDLDHMRGLVALNGSEVKITNFWDTNHDKDPEFHWKGDEEEWKEYLALGDGKRGSTVLHLLRGSTGKYYNTDQAGNSPGDGLEILSPTQELIKEANEAGDTNNLSYVLRLRYAGVSVIFGSDAEDKAWDSIVDHYGDDLKCNVLKASHHGRDSGYHQEAVRRMNPQFTIVSVGKKPSTDASNKYRQYSQNVWSTRWRGNIRLEIADTGQATIYSEYDR
jgi:competence protein ComEC